MNAPVYEIAEGKEPDLFNVEYYAESSPAPGECHIAAFSGPEAERRAREYADWKNATMNARAEVVRKQRNAALAP